MIQNQHNLVTTKPDVHHVSKKAMTP